MALNLIIIPTLKLLCQLSLIRYLNFVNNEITFKLFTVMYVTASIDGM